MPKNIVLCSDGTGNSARKFHGTNVKRLFDAVARTNPRQRQIAFYDDGVGTEKSRLLRLLGGAIGYGLSRNIREIYSFLALNYEPGDRIFLFGFSRGAHTVRAVAGMIAKIGIVAPHDQASGENGGRQPLPVAEFERRVRLAYRVYRRLNGHSLLAEPLFRLGLLKDPVQTCKDLRAGYAIRDEGADDPASVPIEFVGVWDTVDAVGAPMPELADVLDALIWRFRFKDFDLSDQVRKGCQALAIDDARQTFHPVLWNETKELDPAPGAAPRVEQVWFAGMHANVGGGYPRDGLALVPLLWMMEKAEVQGLKFRKELKDRYKADADACGTMHNSRAGLAAFYRYKPRYLESWASGRPGAKPRRIYGTASPAASLNRIIVHSSVFERAHRRVVPYAPVGLPLTRTYVREDRDAAAMEKVQPLSLNGYLESARAVVWWQRVHYYAFVGLTIAFVLIGFRPGWFGLTLANADWLWFQALVVDLRVLVPAIVDPLVRTYAARSLILLVILTLAVGLYVFNNWLNRRMASDCDAAWRHSFGYGTGDAEQDRTWLHRIALAVLATPVAPWWTWFTQRVWPWIATGLLLAVLVWGLAIVL